VAVTGAGTARADTVTHWNLTIYRRAGGRCHPTASRADRRDRRGISVRCRPGVPPRRRGCRRVVAAGHRRQPGRRHYGCRLIGRANPADHAEIRPFPYVPIPTARAHACRGVPINLFGALLTAPPARQDSHAISGYARPVVSGVHHAWDIGWTGAGSPGAYCKTVGSAYVGSNPTPATHLRSEPVTLDCVTGFPRERERFIRPSAVLRGLCVGRIRPSPASAGIASDATWRVAVVVTFAGWAVSSCPNARLLRWLPAAK
jgi:hypothetical protein